MRIAFLVPVAVALLGCGPEVTFSEQIAPILQAKCQSCHRPGQMAPMSLLTYEEVRPFAPAIRTSIAIGNMPPFYAAGPRGYYKHDIRLTPEEEALIIEWADSGAPEGDSESLPPPIEWDDSRWPLGEPDLVLRFPVHSPLPSRRDHWVTFFASEPFSDDIYARVIHVKTRTAKAVHHSTLFLVDESTEIPTSRKALDDLHLVQAARGGLFTWFPGLVVDPLPEGQAILLRAGARLAARTHFGPAGKRRVEQMDVGIYFADGIVDRIPRHLGFRFVKQIRIPPGASDFTLRGSKVFKEDALITHFMVHMHLRGKSSKIMLQYPDGSRRLVFNLPRYRFYWQRYYYLAEPIPVPKGTAAGFVAVWDNSAANPLNPNPEAWCGWGQRSSDEMYDAAIFYTPQRKLANPLQIENGRRAGPRLRAAGS